MQKSLHRAITAATVVAGIALGSMAFASGGWTAVASPTSESIYGLDCSAVGHCIGVGASGTIIRNTSTAPWATVSSGTTESLLSVDNYSTTFALAVGFGGTILRSTNDGASWTSITGVTTEDIYGVSIISGTVAWIAATDGSVFHTVDGGVTWSAVSDNGSIDPNNMDATSSSTAWVIGNNAGTKIAMTSDGGATWTQQAGSITEALYAIDMYTSTVGIVGGANAFSAYTMDGGTTWHPSTVSSFSATEAVADIIMTSASNAIIVGNAGHYAFTTNGGITWSGGSTGASALYDVAVPSTGSYVASAASGGIYVYDTTMPIVGTPSPTTATSGTSTTFSVTASDDATGVSGCTLYVNSASAGAMTGASGTYTLAYSFSSAGTYSVYVTCFDFATNSKTSDTISVVVSAASTSTTTDTTSTTDTTPTAPDAATAPSTPDETSGAAATASAGDLVKMPCASGAGVNDPCKAVYYLGADGKRHAFPNEKVYFTWYVDFRDVVIVTSSYMASLTLGHNVTYHPGTKMVKFLSVNTVYAVATDGSLRAIDSETTASAIYGSKWNTKIDDISDAFFTNYTFGANITSSADYSAADALASVTSIDDIL